MNELFIQHVLTYRYHSQWRRILPFVSVIEGTEVGWDLVWALRISPNGKQALMSGERALSEKG